MGRTDPGAGQHRDGRFGNHRHVERNKVALTDSHGLEGIGCLADLPVQLPIGEGPHIAGFTFPDQCCLLCPGAIEMTVKAVVGEVCGPPFEPTGEWSIRPVENGVKRFEPMQLATGRVSPETIGVAFRCIRQSAVGLKTADPCLGGNLGRRIEHPLLLQHAFDRRFGVGHSRGRNTQRQGKERNRHESSSRINLSDS
ncbi:MAG: Uncharacterised protein [Synechococcus sp. CC9902]|nr:MAG: Uncharacterised protein [Synechococcus sp. CC9902]